MANSVRPRRLALPRSRRLTTDVLHYYRQVPTCAHDRTVDLRELAQLRRLVPRRISWSMIFIKAFGLVAEKRPVLRQTYMRWPWPHLYEHHHSVAMVALERQFRNEPWLFWARFSQPERKSLLRLQETLDWYQREPVESVFLRQFQLSGLPTPVRRALWWWTLNVSGQGRARRSGTFFLTTLAGKQTVIQHPPAFLTANMTYGPLDEHDRSRVTIAYDHRLMDGSVVADCLSDIEAALRGPIAAELETLIRSSEGSARNAEQRAA